MSYKFVMCTKMISVVKRLIYSLSKDFVRLFLSDGQPTLSFVRYFQFHEIARAGFANSRFLIPTNGLSSRYVAFQLQHLQSYVGLDWNPKLDRGRSSLNNSQSNAITATPLRCEAPPFPASRDDSHRQISLGHQGEMQLGTNFRQEICFVAGQREAA